MIEAKLLVGRFLQIDTPANRAPTGNPPAFINVACPPLTIAESTRRDPGAKLNPLRNVGGQRQSAVAAGTNANKVHRNFKWLPWYQGDISETVLDKDVLTGPMSGCILVSYRDLTGATKVGHIGTITVTPTMPATINTNVRALWNAFALAHPGNVIGGFNPADAAVPIHPAAQPGDQVGQTWGLFTTNGDYYAVKVWVQGGHPIVYRIAAVHHIASMTLAQLQAL